MKRIITSFLIVLVFSGILSAKPLTYFSEDEKPKVFYFGAGLGIGFFSPENINNYITDYYHNIDPTIGTYKMMMYYDLNMMGSFFFSKYTELQIEAGWAFSSKIINVNNTSEFFFYQRLTPALKFNFHIPLSKKISYFIGTGASYSFLSFSSPEEKYSGHTPGFTGQTGIMIKFRKIAIQPGFTFNLIKADVNNAGYIYGNNPVILNELSFTGGQIGCKVMF